MLADMHLDTSISQVKGDKGSEGYFPTNCSRTNSDKGS